MCVCVRLPFCPISHVANKHCLVRSISVVLDPTLTVGYFLQGLLGGGPHDVTLALHLFLSSLRFLDGETDLSIALTWTAR